VRVHEVTGSADAVRVAAAWRAAGAQGAWDAPDDEMPVDEDATAGRSGT